MDAFCQIEKLNGKNYESWKIQMRSVLVLSDLWKIVSGEIKKENSTPGYKWDEKDRKALALISLNVIPSQIVIFKTCNTSHSAWIKLRDLHIPNRLRQKLCLYDQLIQLRYSEGMEMTAYIDKFSKNIKNLADDGIILNEKLTVLIMLSNVPSGFRDPVTLMYKDTEMPSLDEVKNLLLRQYSRKGTTILKRNANGELVRIYIKQENRD